MISVRPFEKALFYLALVFFVAGGLLRACFVDFSDLDYGVYSDHFINAVTAKNITIGLNWSSSGYETYLLNPENLTVGPTVVLPVVAAVLVFGNKLAVPGITVFLLNVLLLILVLRAIKNTFGSDRHFYLCAFLLIILFIFFKSYYWYRMIGEIPALLLLILVVIYLSQYLHEFRLKTLFMASVAGTLAMGTKELVLLPVLMLCFILVYISYHSRKNKGWMFWLGRPLLLLSICSIMPLMFFFYRALLLQTQTEAWRSAYFAYANGIHDYYSGMNTLQEYFSSPARFPEIFLRVAKSALWNGGTLLQFSFIGMRSLQYWLCIYAAFLTYLLIIRKFTISYTMLGLSALPLLVWYFCISEKAMPRHLYLGLALAIIAILFYIASIKPASLRYSVTAFVVALIVLSGDQSSRLLLRSWPTSKSANFLAAEEMQRYIEKLPPKSLAWTGMFDNNELEYLAKTPNNFLSGFDLLAESVQFDELAYLDSHPQVRVLIAQGRYQSAFDFYISPDNRQRETIKVALTNPHPFDRLSFKDDVTANVNLSRGDMCKTIIFQNSYYVIERCTSADLRDLLDKYGGLPIRPRKWRPYIMLPSERPEAF